MNIQNIHDLLILLHAAAATLAFLAGSFLLFAAGFPWHRPAFAAYLWSLVAMVLLLAAALAAGWGQFSPAGRPAFVGLLGLALYMLYRALQAGRIFQQEAYVDYDDYIEHIGFTLISLFEGFIIVALVNSGASLWLIVPVAVLGVLAGRWAIAFAQRRAVV